MTSLILPQTCKYDPPATEWESIFRPSTRVNVLFWDVVHRSGENVRQLSVVYERNGQLFSRGKQEFLSKFRPAPKT